MTSHEQRPENAFYQGFLIAALIFSALALAASPARSETTAKNATKNTAENTVASSASELPALPEAIASFGAAIHNDAVYVYGGHVGKTHAHSVENLSHRFRRLDLKSSSKGWEDLGEVPGLQGLAMVSLNGKVCRVGGLTARNLRADEEEDLHSVADFVCYDASTARWQDYPPMPTPRSSHDAVVINGHLYVVGGWQLKGTGEKPVWATDLAILDPQAGIWRTVPQSFQRRALAAATTGGKLYVFGGLGTDGTSRDVNVFDPATEIWIQGPELPKMQGKMKGFGVSAFGVGERIFLSGADGIIHAIGGETGVWQEDLGKLRTPRFFHRLLPHGERLVFIAGASQEGHLSSTESHAIATLGDAAPADSTEE